jgi:hypothetical protein
MDLGEENKGRKHSSIGRLKRRERLYEFDSEIERRATIEVGEVRFGDGVVRGRSEIKGDLAIC